MATFKRKFSDAVGEGSGHGPGAGGFDPKRQKNKHTRKKTKPDNLNWLKKRVRNIERQFRGAQNLPANKRIDLERELAHHKQKIEEATEDKERKHMISKYHMVRFFERRKAERLAKQIEKQIKTCEDPQQKEKLEADLHVAQIDTLYTRYFPFLERYISLYPAKGSAQDTEQSEAASTAQKALRSERPPMWSTIEAAAKQGTTALVEIQERGGSKGSNAKRHRQDTDAAEPGSSKGGEGAKYASSSKASKNQSKTKPKADPEPEGSDDDDGEGSDGGFFETG